LYLKNITSKNENLPVFGIRSASNLI